MPTELELIALQTEFDLYLGFVKRLVLDLPNSKDRTKAALWLQKLRNVTADDQMKLRNEHLKLFLFALHRRSLVGVFQKKPPKEELESFHDGLTLMEMTRELIEITERQKTETKKEGEPGFGLCPLPVVTTSLSCDMKEYAACQEIPLFGSHCFYAVSSEPIQLWTKSPGQSYPGQGDVPNQLEWELSMSKLTDHVLEMQAAIDAARDAEEQAESGFVFDEGPQEEQKEERLEVTPCKESTPGKASPNVSFKWKNDSILTIHQTYDFSDVGVAEDLEEQGKSQLETDEEVLAVLDDSLPGRKRLHVRSPFYSGFPPDLAERRHHGVYDEVPEIDEDECFGPPCEEEEDECDDGGDDYDGSNYGSGSCFCDEPHENNEGASGGRPSGTSNMSSFGTPRGSGGFTPDQMPMASKGSIVPPQNGNGRSSKGNRGSNSRPC